MSTVVTNLGSLSTGQRLRSSPWLAYAAALGLPILTLLLRLAFWDYVPGFPFLAFVPSVLIVTLMGGPMPGAAAAILSGALALGFLTEPAGVLPASQTAWIGLGFHLLVSAVIVVSTHVAAQATAQKMQALEAQATARERALRAELELSRAVAAQSQSERRLSILTDALPVLIAHVGRDLRYEFANRAYEEWFGLSRDEIPGRHLEDVLGPEVVSHLRPHIDAVLEGRPVTFEQQVPHASGGPRDVQAYYVPHLGAEGEVEGFYVLAQDVTETRRQSALLAQRERQIRAVMESVSDGFYAVDAEWRITLVDRAAERYFGRTQEELIGQNLWEAFPSLIGSESERVQRQVMQERTPVAIEAQSVIHPGRFIDLRVVPKDGSGIAVAFSDITERKLADQHRELLINELNHRVKNTLAVVQSMASQTFRDPRVPLETRAAFEGRLMALSTAHDLLTRENWASARLQNVIEDALRPFGVEHRFDLSGPDIRIGPKAAVSLALGLHELATNAVKYGALSRDAGQVSVEWQVSDGTPAMFRLTWRERGGPEVVPPSRKGFGSRLVRQGLAGELGGTVTLDYEPEGVCCAVEAPLTNLGGH